MRRETMQHPHSPQHRNFGDGDADSYRTSRKYAEPTVCPDCRAVFHRGRWQWLEPPDDAQRRPCPACLRVREAMPAGYLNLAGEHFDAHIDEIRNLIWNVAEHARQEHPLKRIIDVQLSHRDGLDGWLITTTDSHLAREIGEAVKRAHQGQLDYQYNPHDNLLRARWLH